MRYGHVAAVLCLAFGAGAVPAETWLPLDIGNAWNYVNESQQVETWTMDREGDLWGNPILIMEMASDEYGTAEAYFSNDEEGDVFLWGQDVDGLLGVLFFPPIPYLRPPLYVGKTWGAECEMFHVSVDDSTSLPDTTSMGWITAQVDVVADTTLTVPAGEFDVFGTVMTIGGKNSVDQLPDLRILGLGGERTSADGYFSQNTGVVKHVGSDGYFELTSFDVPTSTSPSSWGSVKSLFR